MRMQIGHKYDVDWDACIHAIISGIGSAICIYLNIYAAVPLNGIAGKCEELSII
jgi:shikimate kinase